MNAHRPTKVDGRTRHGLSYTVEYRALLAAIGRCRDKNHPAYANYGGRGIQVYQAWVDDPWLFIDHVGERPGKGYDLDRIDNDGHYEPCNVRWVTRKTNLRNKRGSRWEWDGKQMCASECAEMAGISNALFRWRVNHGFTMEQIMTMPADPRVVRDPISRGKNQSSVNVTIDGKEYYFAEACRIFGVPYDTAWRRVNIYKWNTHDAFKTPVAKRHARS